MLLAAALGASHTAHAGGDGQLEAFVGTGYRHSFGLDAGGFQLTTGVGGYLGPVGFEYQLQLSNDHTFAKVDARLASRTTNWFNVLLRVRAGDLVEIGLAFGPGMGFVKNAGPSHEVGGRFPSQGVHEELRLGLNLSDDDFVIGVRLRGGVEHSWQYAIVRGPELAVQGGLELYLGPRG